MTLALNIAEEAMQEAEQAIRQGGLDVQLDSEASSANSNSSAKAAKPLLATIHKKIKLPIAPTSKKKPSAKPATKLPRRHSDIVASNGFVVKEEEGPGRYVRSASPSPVRWG